MRSFGIPDVSTNAGFGVGFILLVIGLVLKHQKLISFIVGTIVGQVRHVHNKIIKLKLQNGGSDNNMNKNE